MRNAYLIAIGAGIVSAIAFVSAIVGAPVANFFLFMIAALPLYVAGIGWSWAAALLATSIGSLLLVALGIKEPAIMFALLLGMPAVVLTFLADQRRDVTEANGTVSTQWISPGFIVIAAAVVASLISFCLVMTSQDQTAKLRTGVEEMIKQAPALTGERELSQEQITQIVDISMLVMPGAVSLVAMMGSLFSLWVAGRMVSAAGQLRRPWPDLAALRFPRGTPLILAAAAIGSSSFTGTADIAAIAVFGAFFIAYLLLGLAVVHYITRGKSWRPFALSAIYVALILINMWAAIPIILLGLMDTAFSLRKPPPAGSGTI